MALLTPEEIKNKKFRTAFSELLCLSISLRFAYFKIETLTRDKIYAPKSLELLLLNFQSLLDLTIKDPNKFYEYLLANTDAGLHKSTVIRYFVSVAVIRDRRCNFIISSATGPLTQKMQMGIANILQSKYLLNLIQLKIHSDNTSSGRLYIGDNPPSMGQLHFATLSITGYDANVPGIDSFTGCIVIDDPHQMNATENERNNKVKEYIDGMSGRVREAATTMTVIIGHMVSKDDLSNTILAQNPSTTHHVVIPALNRFNLSNYPQKLPTEKLIEEKLQAHKGINAEKFYLHRQQDPHFVLNIGSLENYIHEIDKTSYDNEVVANNERYVYQYNMVAVDTSTLTKGQVKQKNNPAAIGIFACFFDTTLGDVVYFLEKIHRLTYQELANIDRENGIEPQGSYSYKIEELLTDIINKHIMNGIECNIIIESMGDGVQLYHKFETTYKNHNTIKIHKDIPYKTTANNGLAKYNRLQAMLIEFAAKEPVRFKVVVQPELILLKKEIRHIHQANRTSDDIADTISMALKWAWDEELKNKNNQDTSQMLQLSEDDNGENDGWSF